MGKYINNNLLNGETLIHEAQFSSKAAGVRFVCAVVFALITVISLASGAGGNMLGVVLTAFCMILAPVFVYLSITIIIAKANFELGLTTQRLIGKVGILSVKSMDAPLDKIQNASISYSPIGRMLGYGTIQINTAGGVFLFQFVDDPDSYKSKIMSQIEEYKEAKTRKDAESLARSILTNQVNANPDITENTLFCPKCGTQNETDTIFCRKCGYKIN